MTLNRVLKICILANAVIQVSCLLALVASMSGEHTHQMLVDTLGAIVLGSMAAGYLLAGMGLVYRIMRREVANISGWYILAALGESLIVPLLILSMLSGVEC